MEDIIFNGVKSPNVVQCANSYDRFIPFRPRLKVENSHGMVLLSPGNDDEKQPQQNKNFHSHFYNKLLAGALDTSQTHRILPIVSGNDSGYDSPERSPCKSPLCNRAMQSVFDSPTRCHLRRVDLSPQCMMDIPAFRDDFYTNLFDWSSSNQIAIALDRMAYTWNAGTRECNRVEIGHENDDNIYISALCWDDAGTTLAVANNVGIITMCSNGRILREIETKEKSKLCVIRWSENILYSGTYQGEIYCCDIRCPKELYKANIGHRDVCGMQLLTGTSYMATGSDDGTVIVWDNRKREGVRSIEAHTGCAKALAWCPWRKSVLATGGGSSDRYVRLWHIHTGEKMAEVYTKSQVCGLLWSEEYRELASSLASTLEHTINDIVLWKMNTFNFEPLAILQQHLGRPLHMAMSPDKTTIASAGADETLCLWKCFPKIKRESNAIRDSSPLSLDRSIR